MDSPKVLRISASLGLSSSLFLSGIYFASSSLFLPILYRFPAATNTDIFQELYYRGITVVAPLSITAALSFGVSSYIDTKNRTTYATAAGLALFPLAWTALVMSGGINQLLKASKDATAREKLGEQGAIALLKTWEWQNYVRSFVTVAGGLTGLFTASGLL